MATEDDTDFDPVYDAAGKAFNIDPGLLKGIHGVEDPQNNPTIVSPAGAIGHMQIMPQTAVDLGVDPTSPVQSIWGAANLMRQNIDQYGNVPDALRAYNAGPDQSHWNNPETNAYVGKVASNYVPSAESQETPPVPSVAPPATAAPAQPAAPDAYTQMFGGTDPSNATVPTAQTSSAATEPQPGSPDAYSQIFGSTDPKQGQDVKASWHQGTILGNMASLANDAVNAAGGQIDKGIAYGVNHIPGATSLLQGTALDPQRLLAADQAQQTQAAANDPGGATANQVGQYAGNALGAGLAAETGAGLIGAGGSALAGAVGGTAGRVIQAGANLLTGGGATSLGGKLLTGATSGAVKAAAAGTVMNGNTNGAGTNALVGAALGPASVAVAPVFRSGANMLGRAGSGLLDMIAPADRNALAGATPATDASASEPAANDTTPEAQGASPNASPGPTPTSPPQPEAAAPKVSLGVLPSAGNADALAQKVYDHYAAGGPTTLVQSQIPGVQLTAAQSTGNANLARLESMMRDQNPNAFAPVDAQNTAARNAYAANVIGTPDMIDAATAARDAATSQARTAAFSNKQPVDPTPVIQQVQGLIEQNAGRPTVQAPLQNVLNQIQNVTQTGGTATAPTLQADPEALYNVRKYLGDMIAPRAAGTANDGQAAASQLMQIKPTLDNTVETGAPGFQNYISQFDQLSKPINAMQFLQSKNIVDANGNVQRGPLNSLLNSIKTQQNAPGARMADSVTPQQIGALTNLRDDMNLANQTNLGKSYGSTTAQNLFVAGKTNALMSGTGAHISNLAAGGVGLEQLGPAGAMAGFATRHLQQVYQNRLAVAQEAATNALLNKLVSPTAP